MKNLITLALAFYSATSMAQTAGKPFQLEPGKYSFECWSAQVRSVKGEMSRANDYFKGSLNIVKIGDIHFETSEEQGEHLSGESSLRTSTSSVTKTRISDLGNGLFKVIQDGTSTTSSGDEKPDTYDFKSEATVQTSANGHEFNVKVKNNDEQEKPGFGERVWKKMADGRFVVQGYIREKITTENSDFSVDHHVANSTCIYKKSK